MDDQQVWLYYFTGTGNSYRVARWLEAAARQAGHGAQAVALDAAQPAAEIQPGSAQMVGLVCPTHAFSAPWQMIRFALRLPRGGGVRAFTLLTRGGMLFGKLFIPGLEGAGAYLLALILALKGYHVLGALGLDMPASWTALMPGFSPQTAARIMARAQPRAGVLYSGAGGAAALWRLAGAGPGVGPAAAHPGLPAARALLPGEAVLRLYAL